MNFTGTTRKNIGNKMNLVPKICGANIKELVNKAL
jgi:hypothetical protein